jgi:hypothetical protein
VLGDVKGAFVNAVGLASSPEEFKNRIEFSLIELGLRLIEIEDVELFEIRTATTDPEPLLFDSISELTIDEPVKFGTFHSYKSESNE